MATACKIGIVKENGKVECVVCWRDGHPDTAGETLARYYGTYEKAVGLIAGGHMYDLDKTIGLVKYQSQDKRVPAERSQPVTYMTETAFLRADHGQRYTYLFKDGQWWTTEEE